MSLFTSRIIIDIFLLSPISAMICYLLLDTKIILTKSSNTDWSQAFHPPTTSEKHPAKLSLSFYLTQGELVRGKGQLVRPSGKFSSYKTTEIGNQKSVREGWQVERENVKYICYICSVLVVYFYHVFSLPNSGH